jgi:hypothetical protein
MKSTDGGSPAPEASWKSPTFLDGARKTSDRFKVLFVCRDNSVCSVIAKAILKRWGGGEFLAFSAGIHPASEIQRQLVQEIDHRLRMDGRVFSLRHRSLSDSQQVGPSHSQITKLLTLHAELKKTQVIVH